MSGRGWIGVDLDGTLAFYDKWRGPEHIGAPLVPMLTRVLNWLADGEDVRIFTARVAVEDPERALIVRAIEEWCKRHIGVVLPVTNIKDFGMRELWDDRAFGVVANTGMLK